MGPKMLVLEMNKNEVIRLSREGKSNAFIGEKFGVSGALVGLFLKEYGITSQILQAAQTNDLTKHKDEIIKRYEAGESTYALDKQFSKSPGKVAVFLRRWGVDISRGHKQYKGDGDLKDRADEIIHMYTVEKIGVDTIGARMGSTGSSIRRILNEYGLMRSYEEVRYQVDQTYFENIDTRNKAYTLGFMYSDGNVQGDYSSWRITLKHDDKIILEKIKEDIKYEGDLKFKNARAYKKRNGEMSTSSPQYSLSVGRKKMCYDLFNLGCVPNKTWKLRFPTEKQVPKQFLADFCRGYWDGDGSISTTTFNCSILGNKFFISELVKYLPVKKMPSAYYQQSEQYPDDPDKQLLRYGFGTGQGAIEILQFLYGDCADSLYLPRKRDLALYWLAKAREK